MKTIGSLLSIGLGLFVAINFVHAQDALSKINVTLESRSQLRSQLEALATVEPVAFASLPRSQRGMVPAIGFWSMQNPNQPPLPSNLLGLDVWPLGDGMFVLDDRKVDYAALAEAANDQLVAAGSLKSGGTAMRMMMSSLSSTYAYGNPVYLTNLVVSSTSGMSAAFDIAGGTNNVPYDIVMTTNLLTAWQWLGLGYTSNRYTFSSQPADTAFYRLAKPSKTMTVGWGEDYFSQCDPPAGLTNAMMVEGGGGYTVALLNDGTAIGWGGRVTEGSIPTNLTGIAMIASGINHKVVLLTNGTVQAWGDNFYGEISVPASLTNATVISAQYLHTLALRKDGTVVSWGDTSNPALTNIPASLTNVIAIAAGCNHNLAVKADGTVVAWGDNSRGQCTVPIGLSNVLDVAAGWMHSVALKSDGTVAVWGNNTLGELNVPANLSNVVQIAAAGYPFYSGYTLALKKDGTVVTWGKNMAALPLNGLNNVIAIGAEYDSGFAIRTGPPTPVVTLEPVDQYQLAGGTVSFNTKGQGLYGVTYQWQTNGVNLPGATNTTLTLTNVQLTHQGSYRAVITDNGGYGNLTSSNASFTLVAPPTIISQAPLPTNQVAPYQSYLSLSVVASAPGMTNGFPLSYQWRFNGSNIVGANATNYTLFADSQYLGNYDVVVTNITGAATSLVWSVTMTYMGSYIASGTLAYHLATNAVARTNGHTLGDMLVLAGWGTVGTNLALVTNLTWSTTCWLHGVQGLSATCVGFSNQFDGDALFNGQGLATMVSPRHYLCATHMHPENFGMIVFLGTNNVVYWRKTTQRVDVGDDTSVGILDADLPASVGFLPLMPTNFSNYLPTNSVSFVQGIGMNQDMYLFGEPMTFGSPTIYWDSSITPPLGLATDWNVNIRTGDSSNPAMIFINNQLVLVSHNYAKPTLTSPVSYGPNYDWQTPTINQQMHFLSTNNSVGTDYQLTTVTLTNWPSIH